MLSLTWGLRLAALAIILITGYYAYAATAQAALLFGGVSPTGGPLSIQDFQRHVGNVEMLTQVGAALVAAVVLLGQSYARLVLLEAYSSSAISRASPVICSSSPRTCPSSCAEAPSAAATAAK